jgi:hypothetical protein
VAIINPENNLAKFGYIIIIIIDVKVNEKKNPSIF